MAVETQVSDQLKISNSEIQNWKSCHRKWYIDYYLQQQPKKYDAELGARALGTKVHIALQALYDTHADPVAIIRQLYAEDIKKWPNADDALLKEQDLAVAMLEGYVMWLEETGADEGLDLVAAETVIEVPSSVPGVSLRGKLDQRIHREIDGARLFLDHKPQPLTEPVLTPTGWRKMGDLVVGDYVLGEDGTPRRVLAVYDRGEDEVFDITLNDGVVLRATADHPWWVKGTVVGKWQCVATSDLKAKHHRIASYTPKRDDADIELPIAPYALGMWLANGNRNDGSVCDGVYETCTYFAELTGATVSKPSVRINRKQLYVVPGNAQMRLALDQLNLLGLYSAERFIPDVYIYATSYAQRLELLRGLMDNDGALTTTYSCTYLTTSKRLADDVVSLARSLGLWAKVWTTGRVGHVGTKINGYDTMRIPYSVSIRGSVNPFLHVAHRVSFDAHRALMNGRRGTTSADRIVRAVVASGREPVRCIGIDSPTHLYVTRGWCLTHNTVGNLTPGSLLAIDEQMKFYAMLEYLDARAKNGVDAAEPTDGGLYNMLRKVKRTATAKPPFYERVEVRYNTEVLRSMWMRTSKVIEEIVAGRAALDEGGDHRYLMYPRPSPDCVWKCQHIQLCPMMDDGSNWQGMMAEHYEHVDPHERYQDERTLE